jgi:carbamoyl-phosphate synthase large subunit
VNVLITSAGRRVALVRAFQQEIRSVYSDALVLAADMEPQLSAACQAADKWFRAPPVRDPSYPEALLSICKQHNVAIVVPTIDTELLVLAEWRQTFADEGVHLIVSDADFVRDCRDKRRTARLFRERGFETPQLFDKSAPSFPVFVKPYDGSLSADTCLLRSAEDVQSHHLANERLLFMEYIDPEEHDEYTVDMYFDVSHALICAVPRKRIFVRGGEINKGVTSKEVLLPLVREKLSSLEGARGCINAQFFVSRDGKRTVAIEINPRFGGGYPLSYRAGANYPRWIIGEYHQQTSLSYWENWEEDLLMLRYDDEIIVHGHVS